ncbi:hypothetical protein DL89DRAFT_19039 [Linderina pennispora]|uniref:Uncharacterized protein n=1 Tax=Linderina pennispora TaxID=61395 RepID=A0A1Y1WLX5_9FUNG|nr:uncharacterized protein DL89DRAFT_19039 [Linderina pennispora]ORX74570.1 hypothetical protein DL89DRAFT_19039 [Linderina pennispora]
MGAQAPGVVPGICSGDGALRKFASHMIYFSRVRTLRPSRQSAEEDMLIGVFKSRPLLPTCTMCRRRKSGCRLPREDSRPEGPFVQVRTCPSGRSNAAHYTVPENPPCKWCSAVGGFFCRVLTEPIGARCKQWRGGGSGAIARGFWLYRKHIEEQCRICIYLRWKGGSLLSPYAEI